MNKKIILSIVSFCFIFPLVVSAAWWNPFTWGDWIRNFFTNKNNIEVKVEQPLATTTITKNSATTTPYSDSGIVLLSPNGGEVFRSGDKVDIFFEILDKTIQGTTDATIVIELYKDVGEIAPSGSRPNITMFFYPNSNNKVVWEVPNYIVPGLYKIGVSISAYIGSDGIKYYPKSKNIDYSDTFFTIDYPSSTLNKKPIINSISNPKYSIQNNHPGFEVMINGLNFDENSVLYMLKESKIESVLAGGDYITISNGGKIMSFIMYYDVAGTNYTIKDGEEIKIQIGNGSNLSEPATFIVPERPSLE